MNKEQSISTIKNIIDAALKAGLFNKLEDTVTAINAFNYLSGLEDPIESKIPSSEKPVL